jgi:uncharacterized protein with PIN domain
VTNAHIYFHNPLQELIRSRNRNPLQPIEFKGCQTIKHLVESLGIPHTEVGLLVVHEESIDFGHLVSNGEIVQVQPATSQQDQLSGMFQDGHMTIPARFILDNHLGKLASDLRIMGFDADYSNHYQDQELAETAAMQGRILLTRDRQLLMRKTIRYGYLLRSLHPDEQLLEILVRFNLFSDIQLFQRCTRCNHLLEPVEKQEIEHLLEPLTKRYFFEFKCCTGCGQVYWPGSHVEHIEKRLAGILPPGTFPDFGDEINLQETQN